MALAFAPFVLSITTQFLRPSVKDRIARSDSDANSRITVGKIPAWIQIPHENIGAVRIGKGCGQPCPDKVISGNVQEEFNKRDLCPSKAVRREIPYRSGNLFRITTRIRNRKRMHHGKANKCLAFIWRAKTVNSNRWLTPSAYGKKLFLQLSSFHIIMYSYNLFVEARPTKKV